MAERLYKRLHVKGLGDLGITPGLPCDEASILLESKNLDLIGLRDFAFARLYSEGKTQWLRAHGTYVKESAINYKGKVVFLRDVSLLEHAARAETAVDTQKAEREVYVNKKFFEEHYELASDESGSFENPEDRHAFTLGKEDMRFLDRDNNLFIPTDLFGEVNITRWAFKDIAREYGKFLREMGAEKMPVWFPKRDYALSLENPFIRQVWVCCIKGKGNEKGDSGISTNNRGLHELSRLIGKAKE